MTGARRVVVLTVGAANPFLEAWVAAVRASGASTVAVVDARASLETDVPGVLAADTVLIRPGDDDLVWPQTVQQRLDGPPDAVLQFWGLGALALDTIEAVWPGTPRVLVVDTFPNASRTRAELRDHLRAHRLLPRAAGLVLASRAMGAALDRATFGRFRALPRAVVYSPFPLAAHAGADRPPLDGRPLRLCFTGRSDLLLSTRPDMAKDAVGDHLAAFIAAGAQVYVQHPGDGRLASALLDRGFHFYSSVPRDEIVTGGLARMIAGFDGHLVVYAPRNRTIAARISNSLSTRFATALCAPAPIIAPTEARFVDELFDQHRVGFRSNDAPQALARLQQEGPAMARRWHESHRLWAGEAAAPDLAALWEAVRR